MRQNRYPILLDTEYPPERAVHNLMMSIPTGDRAGFLRVLVLLGHNQIENATDGQNIQAGGQDGNATD